MEMAEKLDQIGMGASPYFNEWQASSVWDAIAHISQKFTDLIYFMPQDLTSLNQICDVTKKGKWRINSKSRFKETWEEWGHWIIHPEVSLTSGKMFGSWPGDWVTSNYLLYLKWDVRRGQIEVKKSVGWFWDIISDGVSPIFQGHHGQVAGSGKSTKQW